MKNQKGNVGLIILIVVLLGLGLWWLMKSGYSLPSLPKQTAGIQNKGDLDAASKDLDSADVSQIDSGLGELSSESSSF